MVLGHRHTRFDACWESRRRLLVSEVEEAGVYLEGG